MLNTLWWSSIHRSPFPYGCIFHRTRIIFIVFLLKFWIQLDCPVACINLSSGTLPIRGTPIQGTVSYDPFYCLTCNHPSSEDQNTLYRCRDTFGAAVSPDRMFTALFYVQLDMFPGTWGCPRHVRFTWHTSSMHIQSTKAMYLQIHSK